MTRDVSQNLKPGASAGESPRPSFEVVLVSACVVAMWADDSMAVAERDALAQLINEVARTKGERDRLQRLVLQELNRHEVMAEIEQLAAHERLHLYDRVVDVLMSDRTLSRRELAFLAELRRRCGVSWWTYQRLVHGLLPRSRTVGLVVGGLVAVLAVFWLVHQPSPPPPMVEPIVADEDAPAKAPPREAAVHPPLLLPSIPDPLPEYSAEELYAAIGRSVVTVIVRAEGVVAATGSGVVLGVDQGRKSYFVVTNRHVVDQQLAEGPALDFEVQFENDARFDAILDFYSRLHDLALLRVGGTPLWAGAASLRPRASLVVGERVYAVGSPMGLRHSFTEGVISALREDAIQTDATVHSGSSGGPLFDRHGLVCGIVTASHVSKDLSFAIYADTIMGMLAERGEVGGAGAEPTQSTEGDSSPSP